MKNHTNASLRNPGNWKDDDELPIEMVNWYDVDTFLQKLNTLTGKNYRLPTNAEWEYAARGCKAGVCDPYKYSGSDNIAEVAWYSGNSAVNSVQRTHVVGQKKPNKLGIHDMSGNLFEWCLDCFDEYHYQNRLTDGNNVNPVHNNCAAGTNRVIRGGGWPHDASLWPRVAARTGHLSTDRTNTRIGFRVVLPAQ
jgi:formylglycine-generating enzyme required for sulfatase activity